MNNEKFCSVDGATMVYSEGISKKNGKPYAMYKCSKCGAVEWGKVAPPRGNTPQIAPQGLTGEAEGLLKQILAELKQINVNTKQFPEPPLEEEDLSNFGV